MCLSRDFARYEFNHEILNNSESFFRGESNSRKLDAFLSSAVVHQQRHNWMQFLFFGRYAFEERKKIMSNGE